MQDEITDGLVSEKDIHTPEISGFVVLAGPDAGDGVVREKHASHTAVGVVSRSHPERKVEIIEPVLLSGGTEVICVFRNNMQEKVWRYSGIIAGVRGVQKYAVIGVDGKIGTGDWRSRSDGIVRSPNLLRENQYLERQTVAE